MENIRFGNTSYMALIGTRDSYTADAYNNNRITVMYVINFFTEMLFRR